MTPLHVTVAHVTRRIEQRSADSRAAYLQRLNIWGARPPGATRLGCANVAHAFAAMSEADKPRTLAAAAAPTAPPQGVTPGAAPSLAGIAVHTERPRNLAIVTAYNDMLSAHAPLGTYPDTIKDEARRHGATAQVAGGVPAMCDGVTQGAPGMELSLFSRDVIAQSTAIALSHDVFDAALMLGVCDKIVPGLLIGALHFGHLPMVFVPAGPMGSGLSNTEKSKLREQAAQGLVDRGVLLDAEARAYHGEGTCTFYGTANSNQMLLEAMGLHVPGTAFVHPGLALREHLTREAVREVLHTGVQPIGRIVDERCIVNAMVALLATGGSTNHLIHWNAVARAAGIVIDWSDWAELSAAVPLIARVYPNGHADVNQFQAAGGPGYVIRELLDAGLMHANVHTVHPGGLRAHAREPVASAEAGGLSWVDVGASRDSSVLRPTAEPFAATGGLKVLQGNLGRAVIKISAVPEDRHRIEAPARVFDSQDELLAAFNSGALEQACRDNQSNTSPGGLVCVVRWQGPQANGMPELHKLTPPLAVLQGKGLQVALVTDGRMSGASGKVPAAIHVSPEAAAGGPLAKLRDGDRVLVDADHGQMQALVAPEVWDQRVADVMPDARRLGASSGLGRELFSGMRRAALPAEQGACTWL